jgi:uncharacterized membrane protein
MPSRCLHFAIAVLGISFVWLGSRSTSLADVGDHGHPAQHGHHEQADSEEHGPHHEHHGVGSSPQDGPFLHFLGWLGKFHPPAVNFPIGVLVAAAVAEALFMARGGPMFDAASRYCVWLGAVAAWIAAFLGWLFAGLRWADSGWVMTTHRWLGTSTALVSIVVLLLSERSRVSGRSRARRVFRLALFGAALLVLTTGFFGGSMVYGLNHYAWP